MSYNSFCPVAKAMDLLGERWTLLIVRELLNGGSRFSELQRGLPSISPTLLTKRLAQLEKEGLVYKKRVKGQRGNEYHPTQACQELFPVIEQIGVWGMQWARHQLTEDDFDLELLMLYMERSIRPEKLIGDETIIRFSFNDVADYNHWWIIASKDELDVCVHDPGKEVDVYINTTVRTMSELWMGDIGYKQAQADGSLKLVGPKALTRSIESWIEPSIFAGLQPANTILTD